VGFNIIRQFIKPKVDKNKNGLKDRSLGSNKEAH